MKAVWLSRGGWVYAPDGAEVLHSGSARAKPLIRYNGVVYKHCPCCGTWRALGKFHRKSDGYFGLQSYCARCKDECGKDGEAAGWEGRKITGRG